MNPPLQLRRRKTTRKRRASSFYYSLPDDPRPALPWSWLLAFWLALYAIYKLAAWLMPESFS